MLGNSSPKEERNGSIRSTGEPTGIENRQRREASDLDVSISTGDELKQTCSECEVRAASMRPWSMKRTRARWLSKATRGGAVGWGGGGRRTRGARAWAIANLYGPSEGI